jgi:glycosyltransferase involved in cell wall biosynthesis
LLRLPFQNQGVEFMRILLIHQVFASPEQAGGTRHFELLSRLVQSRNQATVVASNLSYLSGKQFVSDKQWVTEQNIEGIRVLRAYTYPSLHRSFVWRVVSFLSFMVTAAWAGWKAGKVDVVMGTSPPLTQPLSAWLIAVLRRRPFLLEIRDLWPEFAIDMGVLKNPFLIWVARRLEMFLYRRATHLLVNSPAYRDYLISKGMPAAKVSLVANGVDPAMFDPAADGRSIRKEFGLEGKFVVLYAGALGKANDIDTLLDAADLVRHEPQIHFLLAGDGKERPNLEAKAKQLQLSNVTFTGALPKHRMPEVLASADVCVAILLNIPMFTTPYPNKVFDYMAAGRPIVLGIDGVIRKVVEAADGGIFSPPGDAQSLAAAIQKLHSDPQAARQMGHRARDYVVKYFNRDRQADQFATLVSRLVNGIFDNPVDSQSTQEVPIQEPPASDEDSLQPALAATEQVDSLSPSAALFRRTVDS